MKLNFLQIFMTMASLSFFGTACAESHDTRDTPADYVSTLVGTQSKHSFSTGNTYPAIARPWGMNFWTPMTGTMGNG